MCIRDRVIAEDLGVSVPEVKQLLADTGLPGMKIIEFAFGGGSDNEHLPHNYASNCVAVSYTHLDVYKRQSMGKPY